MKYKHALLLHKYYNDSTNSPEWLDLFTNQTFNDRMVNANFLDLSTYKIGKNIISNRFTILNNKIPLVQLNKDYLSFKLTCKNMFIVNDIWMWIIFVTTDYPAEWQPCHQLADP